MPKKFGFFSNLKIVQGLSKRIASRLEVGLLICNNYQILPSNRNPFLWWNEAREMAAAFDANSLLEFHAKRFFMQEYLKARGFSFESFWNNFKFDLTFDNYYHYKSKRACFDAARRAAEFALAFPFVEQDLKREIDFLRFELAMQLGFPSEASNFVNYTELSTPKVALSSLDCFRFHLREGDVFTAKAIFEKREDFNLSEVEASKAVVDAYERHFNKTNYLIALDIAEKFELPNRYYSACENILWPPEEQTN